MISTFQQRVLTLLVCCVFFLTGMVRLEGTTGTAQNSLLTITLEGSDSVSYTYETLLSLSCELPRQAALEDSEELRGVSLNELVPVLVEAWNLKVTTQDAQAFDFPIENLAGQLSEIYIILPELGQQGRTLQHDKYSRGNSYKLVIQNQIINAVESLTISGEISDETQATVWVSWEGVPLLKNEIERFATLHNISIEVVEVPNIASKLIQTHRGGGKVPDLVMVQSDYLVDLIASESLQNLDYMQVDSSDKKGLDAMTLYQKLWAIPLYCDTQLLFIRPEKFSSETGSRTFLKQLKMGQGTLEEYLALFQTNSRAAEDSGETPEKVQNLDTYTDSNGIEPLSWNLYSAYWLAAFQLGFGKTQLVEPDGSIKVNDEPTKHAVEFLLEQIDNGTIVPMEREAMISRFISGKTAGILSSSFMIPEFERLEVPFVVIPYPLLEETHVPLVPFLDYKALAIPKKSRSPIIARRLLEFLTGIGFQTRFTNATAKIPAHSGSREVLFETSPYAEVYKVSLERGTPVPAGLGYSVYKDIMWNMLKFIVSGQLSVQDGLDEANRLILQKMSDKGAFHEQKTIDPAQETLQPGSSDNNSGNTIIQWLRNLFSKSKTE